MISSELTGKQVASFDSRVEKFLASRAFDSSGNTMVVAIENESGEIYRTITVSGLGDFMSVVGFLQRLKLVDKLEDALGPIGGFDCRFLDFILLRHFRRDLTGCPSLVRIGECLFWLHFVQFFALFAWVLSWVSRPTPSI